ncbi:NAD(P)-binding protein [Rhizodiscina lignyota]|uniref:NAD(P)-binding protein n=1 Tax=Rhizodiscina lignyota TaxID=1504668 RepID=A0A9P4M5A8_9PEZI|nr:NAD(P)-binding protein [Rhizodiscina lignyota]
MSKVVLITGATGKQGGATIDALLASPRASEFTILGVTRNPSSPSAQKLLSKGSNVKVIKGDLNDCSGIFEAAKNEVSESVWGVFSVQIPMGNGQTVETEEKQGKALVDEALKNGVKHFVYTSVDRQGDKSYDNPTSVPHFVSKHNIEHHLVDSTKGTDMGWTILRPTAFFEGIAPGMMGRVFVATFRMVLKDRPVQFISVPDIGHFAAEAFLNPDKFNGRAISLAGDELTFAQIQQIFKEKTGTDLPESYSIFATLLLWMVKEVNIMMKWFHDEGYGVDIPALRKEYPGLMDFGSYLEKRSGFEIKK